MRWENNSLSHPGRCVVARGQTDKGGSGRRIGGEQKNIAQEGDVSGKKGEVEEKVKENGEKESKNFKLKLTKTRTC